MGSASPMFSVVVPTVDRPAMLTRALRSVAAQRDVLFEIIVADDGSGVGVDTARAVTAGRAIGFVTGRLGQVPARNLAIAKARGRWIAFLDDDDWWAEPDHLRRLQVVLEGGAGFAYASGRMVREDADVSSGEEIDFAAHIDAASVCRDNTLLISGIAYERGLHGAAGPLDTALPHYWDWDWYLRLVARSTRFADGGGRGVRISVRSDSVSSAANETLRRAELDRLCAKHGLCDIILKNHEGIALEQREAAGARSA